MTETRWPLPGGVPGERGSGGTITNKTEAHMCCFRPKQMTARMAKPKEARMHSTTDPQQCKKYSQRRTPPRPSSTVGSADVTRRRGDSAMKWRGSAERQKFKREIRRGAPGNEEKKKKKMLNQTTVLRLRLPFRHVSHAALRTTQTESAAPRATSQQYPIATENCGSNHGHRISPPAPQGLCPPLLD